MRRIGFRVLNLVTVNDTNATERAIAQRSEGSGSHTMMFRVNGSPLHARGGNMIPMEMFEARLSADAYRRLVISAAEGGFNMLRVWGGGSFYHDAFFDAADEHGVLIYHDMLHIEHILHHVCTWLFASAGCWALTEFTIARL